jgi:NADPH-ferrihemoprotein reductase
MWLYLISFLAIVGGIYYWFFVRDDGGFPEDEVVLNIKPSTFTSLKKPVQKVKKEGLPMKVLFYSQTGTAEDFATRFGEDAGNFGFSPDMVDVESATDTADDLANEKLIVFFAATYGEGDPPDNAIEFHTWLMEKEKGFFTSNTKFAVFGLGNKTYDKFNEIGKAIDKKMEELGAKRIQALGCGDDDDNNENDFLIWKKAFSEAVCREFELPPPGNMNLVDVKCKQKIVEYPPQKIPDSLKEDDLKKITRWRVAAKRPSVVDRNTPFLAKILTIKELHGEGSDRSCLHVEVSTHGKLLQYLTGSHIGIYPENDPELVKELGQLLNVNLNNVISIHMKDFANSKPIVGPCTIEALLTQYFDISYHAKKQLLRVLAQYATNPTEKDTLHELATDDPSQQQKYESWIVKDQRTVIDVLREFPSVKVPLDHFFEVLPKMQPRMYSISSSPNIHKETVHITAVVTNWISPIGKKMNGVTTTWFAKQKLLIDSGKEVFVPAFIRKSNFTLPGNLAIPIVMIGPGTGLAPFRGFIQELKYRWSMEYAKSIEKPETILFFGCRNEHDFIYKDELQSYTEEKVLTSLQTALSRVGPNKVYVQHLMAEPEMKAKIWRLINAKGYIYICGDAKAMAKDVSKILTQIIHEEGNMNLKEAEKFLDRLSTQGRFLQDVWS